MSPQKRPYKLCVIASHPIQYQAPLWQRMAQDPDLDVTVYYCSSSGVSPTTKDSGFGVSYVWDIPLFDGYRHVFLTNLAVGSAASFLRLINPSLVTEIVRNPWDGVLVTGWGSFSHCISILISALSGRRVFLFGDSSSRTPVPSFRRVIKSLLLPLAFRLVSGFMVTGAFNREFYIQYKVPIRRLFPFPMSIDNARFSVVLGTQERNDLRRKWGVAPDLPLVLFSGKLIDIKRPMDLLVAKSRVPQGCFGVVFAGDGVLRDQLMQFVEEQQLRDVVFLGFVNQKELPSVYAACDVLCLPSERDARGLVVNEAMACGLPVVVSSGTGVWGPGDLVRHGENGFVVEVGDTSTLANYLNTIAVDPAFRARASAKSREIIAKWTYDECVVGLKQALATCVR